MFSCRKRRLPGAGGAAAGLRQRRRGAATLEAALTTVNAVAYLDAARRVDRPAAWLAAPYAAWIGFAALLSEELWRRNRGRVE